MGTRNWPHPDSMNTRAPLWLVSLDSAIPFDLFSATAICNEKEQNKTKLANQNCTLLPTRGLKVLQSSSIGDMDEDS